MAKTVYCSFCGASNHEVGMMMEGSDKHISGALVRICRKCAEEAMKMIDEIESGQNPA